MALGFKQQAILEEFKKRKRMTTRQVAKFYGNQTGRAMNTLNTLELMGYIKLDKSRGLWVIL